MDRKKRTILICVAFVIIFIIGYYYTGKQKDEIEKRYLFDQLYQENINKSTPVIPTTK